MAMRNPFTGVSIPLILSSVGVLGAFVALLWSWVVLHKVDGPVIISFTSQLGILRVGTPATLYGSAAVACIALFMNLLLVRALEKRNRFLANFSAITTLFLGFLIFVAYAAIIAVN